MKMLSILIVFGLCCYGLEARSFYNYRDMMMNNGNGYERDWQMQEWNGWQDCQGYHGYRDGCFDNHRMCSFWASEGRCQSHQRYMYSFCRQSCNYCEGWNGWQEWEGEDWQMQDWNGWQDWGGYSFWQDGFRDNHGMCSSWASEGHCQSYPRFMYGFCRQSCSFHDDWNGWQDWQGYRNYGNWGMGNWDGNNYWNDNWNNWNGDWNYQYGYMNNWNGYPYYGNGYMNNWNGYSNYGSGYMNNYGYPNYRYGYMYHQNGYPNYQYGYMKRYNYGYNH